MHCILFLSATPVEYLHVVIIVGLIMLVIVGSAVWALITTRSEWLLGIDSKQTMLRMDLRRTEQRLEALEKEVMSLKIKQGKFERRRERRDTYLKELRRRQALERGRSRLPVIDESTLTAMQIAYLYSPLSDAGLPVRILNTLKANGANTVKDACLLTEDELRQYKNFGKKSLFELQSILEDHGLSMGVSYERPIQEEDANAPASVTPSAGEKKNTSVAVREKKSSR